MINYAHRGASHYAPENTLAAFYMGLEMKANGIETDIQRSRDGVLVLHHDDTLRRTAGVERSVRDCDYAELLEMDFGARFNTRYAGERIVAFETFWRHFSSKPIHLALEIKQAGIEAQLMSAIEGYDPGRLIVTSFALSALEAMRALDPTISLGYLTQEIDGPVLDRLEALRIGQICPHVNTLCEESITLARSRGFSVRAWGVSDEARMDRAIACRVDGMTINFPDRLHAALEAAGLA